MKIKMGEFCGLYGIKCYECDKYFRDSTYYPLRCTGDRVINSQELKENFNILKADKPNIGNYTYEDLMEYVINKRLMGK